MQNDKWFELSGDMRLGECASEGCGQQPTYRLETGGIGANYCSACRAKIDRAAALPTPDVAELIETVSALQTKEQNNG
jgi:hypothetical protein